MSTLRFPEDPCNMFLNYILPRAIYVRPKATNNQNTKKGRSSKRKRNMNPSKTKIIFLIIIPKKVFYDKAPKAKKKSPETSASPRPLRFAASARKASGKVLRSQPVSRGMPISRDRGAVGFGWQRSSENEQILTICLYNFLCTQIRQIVEMSNCFFWFNDIVWCL